MTKSFIYGVLCSYATLLWIYLGTLGFRVWQLKKVNNKTKMTERIMIGLAIKPMKKFFIVAGMFGFIYALCKKPIKV
jgi:cytochrome oxidase assembly protein ShyY1